MTAKELAKLKGIDYSTACKWIREDGIERALVRIPLTKSQAGRRGRRSKNNPYDQNFYLPGSPKKIES